MQIVVKDNGMGISAEFLPHVFELFRQGVSTITRAHDGLGLGLAIVKELVAMHGGTIEASSDGSGRGATFTINLPLHLPL
jgi:signal transduction histidine kinase